MADPLRAIVDDLSIGILFFDGQGRVAVANRRAIEALSLPADVEGKPAVGALPSAVWSIIHPLLESPSTGPVVKPLAGGSGLSVRISTSPGAAGTLVEVVSSSASGQGIPSKVGHDLKTPLTSIKAYTEALTDLASDEQVKNFLGVINEETDRLVSMINELVRQGRADAG